MVLYDLAMRRYAFIIVIMLAASIMLHQISGLHRTLYDIVWTLFVVNLLLLAAMLIFNRKEVKEYIKPDTLTA